MIRPEDLPPPEYVGQTWQAGGGADPYAGPVSYTHLRAHATPEHLVCRLLLEKQKTVDLGTSHLYLNTLSDSP